MYLVHQSVKKSQSESNGKKQFDSAGEGSGNNGDLRYPGPVLFPGDALWRPLHRSLEPGSRPGHVLLDSEWGVQSAERTAQAQENLSTANRTFASITGRSATLTGFHPARTSRGPPAEFSGRASNSHRFVPKTGPR